jgi:hypothetical protein
MSQLQSTLPCVQDARAAVVDTDIPLDPARKLLDTRLLMGMTIGRLHDTVVSVDKRGPYEWANVVVRGDDALLYQIWNIALNHVRCRASGFTADLCDKYSAVLNDLFMPSAFARVDEFPLLIATQSD